MEPLLRSIKAENLLSFGPEGMNLELRNLNVLIGPNGSGKSNLFELLQLLKAASAHLATPVRSGGGIRNWIWKGSPQESALIEAVVSYPNGNQPLLHSIRFSESEQKFTLVDERIENERPYPGQRDSYFYYRFQQGSPTLNVKAGGKRILGNL